MANIEDLGKVISTDVLIIGGGIGGIVAAIKAKEQGVDVLVVEKQTVGWAGKAPKGGGALWMVPPDDGVDKVVEFHVRKVGEFLNDQILLREMISESKGIIDQFESWGIKLQKNEQGELNLRPHILGMWFAAATDMDMQIPLRARLRKLGAKIMNKVQVVDLLKQDNRIVGAIGFDLIDCSCYIFKAKSVVIANGSCNYKVRRMWSSGSGDGIAAAYRAGAEMRNADFGNFYDLQRNDTESASVDQRFLVNALGEKLADRYLPETQPDISNLTLFGIEKEIQEGRGPIYYDLSLASNTRKGVFGPWKRSIYDTIIAEQNAAAAKTVTPPSPGGKVEASIWFSGELSCIKVDNQMQTTLPGLCAIGDSCYCGSGMVGAVPAPPGRLRGSGILYAVFSALRGGPSAAKLAKEAAPIELDYAEVKRLKEEMFAPMQHKNGIKPSEVLSAIQEVVFPIKYNLRRSKERMEEGLVKIQAAQRNWLN